MGLFRGFGLRVFGVLGFRVFGFRVFGFRGFGFRVLLGSGLWGLGFCWVLGFGV